MQQKQISLIVPVYNEVELIPRFLKDLKKLEGIAEIIFVDGGSKDASIQLLKAAGFFVISSEKGRSLQLHAGALAAKQDYLLFLHIDVQLPPEIRSVLLEAIQQETKLANFSLRFDWSHWFLYLNAQFSRFTASPFQFGDQGLLISKSLYFELGGFNTQLQMMEGNDLIKRAKKKTSLIKLRASLTVSARKYRKIGPFRLQFIYIRIYLLKQLGYSDQYLSDKFAPVLSSN